jgi:AcrR family transcriptional regulator/transposase
LAAARTAFGRYGYNATTTRAIAQRAGVSEPTIFRQFGSKDALFDAAVLTPFTEFLTQRVADWQQRGPGTAPALEEAKRLFDSLVGLFLEERAIVIAILAVYHYDEATSALQVRLEGAMREVVALVEARSVSEAVSRGNTGFDVSTLARMMVGMCFALVTFPRLFAVDVLSRARMVEEMARVTMYGIEFRDRPLKDTRPVETHRPATEVPVETAVTPAGRRPPRIDNETWDLIAPLLRTRHAPRHGRRRIDDRAVLEGVVEVLASGRPWGELPAQWYGVSGITCWRRLQNWRQAGVAPALAETLARAGIDIQLEDA